jgi:hypothetical protein
VTRPVCVVLLAVLPSARKRAVAPSVRPPSLSPSNVRRVPQRVIVRDCGAACARSEAASASERRCAADRASGSRTKLRQSLSLPSPAPPCYTPRMSFGA